ncbi:hypothetical protein BIY22_07620 [Vibrio panuliri]|uniref:ABC transporter ATP-binding protein n=1 Tax=Vibrio panuliri TaxID=1381081 RepID=A0A1Q9HE78_9VIBR|nr:ABC transporter ATP-binding protein/permease [Vibrio panuliri]OLQ88033.1 hypothetical protein BIY22_07620 [Vibrio panuliri]
MAILKQFFTISKPYWLSRASALSWLLLLATITLSLLLVQVMVKLNVWNKEFFDALAALDGPLIYDLLLQFVGLVAAIVLIKVYEKWLQQWVEIRWRSALTEQLMTRWLSKQNFYYLTLSNEPDNPDQRIAEDIKLLTTDTLKLLINFIKSVATLSAFSIVLWNLSAGFLLPVFADFSVSGYLLWLAIIYSVLGAGITHFFGHKLHNLFYQQQKREANFRARLVRNRDSSELIALMQGQKTEKATLDGMLEEVVLNWKSIMWREKKLGLVVNTYHQIAAVVPYFAAIPALMAKIITVGGLFQVKMAFMKVYSSLSWFVFRYDDLTRWTATIVRLGQFIEAMEYSELLPSAPFEKSTKDYAVRCSNLTIKQPCGKPILENLNLDVDYSEMVMIQGASGLGKSTLLKTLVGAWPYYHGKYNVRDNLLLLPQKPYLTQRTLRECLSYPKSPVLDASIYLSALDLVGLSSIQSELDSEVDWSMRLSCGEQQKLALARALVFNPNVLILDESTCNLDEVTAKELIKKLQKKLTGSTIIMVSHQSNLKVLFDRVINLDNLPIKIS